MSATPFALMVLAVLIGGTLMPGGGVLLATAFRFTTARGHPRATGWLFGIGGFLLLIDVLTIIGNALPVTGSHS